jgi:hypothetical protein
MAQKRRRYDLPEQNLRTQFCKDLSGPARFEATRDISVYSAATESLATALKFHKISGKAMME